MPDVTLVATKDFSYATRRLKAGDSFVVPERMAKVLIGIKKAALQREVGRVPAPSAALLDRAAAVTPKPKSQRRRRAKKG